MELRHLRYFVAVAEELHFGRAALRLHVVQSAVSQQVQKLERELGVTLLSRSRRRVSLTEPGRAFLVEARRTLSRAENAIAQARRAAAGEVGRLRIGYVDLAVYLYLPEILRRYRKGFPDVELFIREMDREDQREALHHGELDLGFFAFREGEGDFGAEEVAADPLVAVLPDGHPAASRERIPLRALRAEPWVLFPRRLQTRYLELILQACAGAGFSPRVVQEGDHLDALAVLVGAGIGVTLLPRSVAEIMRVPVVVRPLGGDGPVLPQHVVWRKDALSPAGERFVAVAREHALRTGSLHQTIDAPKRREEPSPQPGHEE